MVLALPQVGSFPDSIRTGRALNLPAMHIELRTLPPAGRPGRLRRQRRVPALGRELPRPGYGSPGHWDDARASPLYMPRYVAMTLIAQICVISVIRVRCVHVSPRRAHLRRARRPFRCAPGALDTGVRVRRRTGRPGTQQPVGARRRPGRRAALSVLSGKSRHHHIGSASGNGAGRCNVGNTRHFVSRNDTHRSAHHNHIWAVGGWRARLPAAAASLSTCQRTVTA